MSQVPALLRSKTTASDTISIQLIRPKVAYMFEEDFERGSGPMFEDEKTAKDCGGENVKVVKVNITKT